jgi:hypothetical protein
MFARRAGAARAAPRRAGGAPAPAPGRARRAGCVQMPRSAFGYWLGGIPGTGPSSAVAA